MLFFTISWSLLKLMSIELVMPSNHHILCHPLRLSQHRIFSNKSALSIRWLNCWSFSFSISLSNEYSWLIPCRTDWLDLAVQGALASSQFKSINSSALSLLYVSTLTSIPDYWKKHRFDYRDFCWQSNLSAF